jgi:hypothetical protein
MLLPLPLEIRTGIHHRLLLLGRDLVLVVLVVLLLLLLLLSHWDLQGHASSVSKSRHELHGPYPCVQLPPLAPLSIPPLSLHPPPFSLPLSSSLYPSLFLFLCINHTQQRYVPPKRVVSDRETRASGKHGQCSGNIHEFHPIIS